jgi:hypothetical protein
MDTRKLVVGQKVQVRAEYWDRHDEEGGEAEVVLVTASYVEVEFPQTSGPIGLSYRLRFDTYGKAMERSDIYLSFRHGAWELRDEKDEEELRRREVEFQRMYPYPSPPERPWVNYLIRYGPFVAALILLQVSRAC